MTYAADLTFDLTFHSVGALRRHLRGLGLTPAGPSADAWAVISALSEYAHGHLDGAHLTGQGSGRLLPGYPQRLRALARQSEGLLAVVGEDGTRWRHILRAGQVATLLDVGRTAPTAGH